MMWKGMGPLESMLMGKLVDCRIRSAMTTMLAKIMFRKCFSSPQSGDIHKEFKSSTKSEISTVICLCYLLLCLYATGCVNKANILFPRLNRSRVSPTFHENQIIHWVGPSREANLEEMELHFLRQDLVFREYFSVDSAIELSDHPVRLDESHQS